MQCDRLFRLGRTENINPVTEQSVRWVLTRWRMTPATDKAKYVCYTTPSTGRTDFALRRPSDLAAIGTFLALPVRPRSSAWTYLACSLTRFVLRSASGLVVVPGQDNRGYWGHLTVLKTVTFGPHSFAASAPKHWSSSPPATQRLTQFISRLKLIGSV